MKPAVEGKPISPSGETGTVVAETISRSGIEGLKNVKVISITAEENLLNTVYTTEVKDTTGKTKIVTVKVDSEGKPSVVQVQSPQGESAVTQPVGESTSVRETNGQTGETSTIKTGGEVAG